MPELSKQPARVTRHVAMELLCIDDSRTFKKVVDANPEIKHTLPGEKRAKYLTSVIATLMRPAGETPALPGKTRCATVLGRKENQRPEVRGQKPETKPKKT